MEITHKKTRKHSNRLHNEIKKALMITKKSFVISAFSLFLVVFSMVMI
jgi:hypothetical protein